MLVGSLSQSEAIDRNSHARNDTDKYDAYCFDCDGVLWRGPELLPGAATTLALLRRAPFCLSICRSVGWGTRARTHAVSLNFFYSPIAGPRGSGSFS